MLSVRELTAPDVNLILDYWFSRTEVELSKMGAAINKLPTRDQFARGLEEQIGQDYIDKKAYALIWLINDVPIGHNNVNNINYNEDAFMHLHIWQIQHRHSGLSQDLLKKSIPFFFKNLKLKKLICEPYALNPAPNKALEKLGFAFIKRYDTIPGSMNFKQSVNRWELSFQNYQDRF